MLNIDFVTSGIITVLMLIIAVLCYLLFVKRGNDSWFREKTVGFIKTNPHYVLSSLIIISSFGVYFVHSKYMKSQSTHITSSLDSSVVVMDKMVKALPS